MERLKQQYKTIAILRCFERSVQRIWPANVSGRSTSCSHDVKCSIKPSCTSWKLSNHQSIIQRCSSLLANALLRAQPCLNLFCSLLREVHQRYGRCGLTRRRTGDHVKWVLGRRYADHLLHPCQSVDLTCNLNGVRLCRQDHPAEAFAGEYQVKNRLHRQRCRDCQRRRKTYTK